MREKDPLVSKKTASGPQAPPHNRQGSLQKAHTLYTTWYRSLFEQTPDAVYLCDIEGYFLDANPAALRLLGY